MVDFFLLALLASLLILLFLLTRLWAQRHTSGATELFLCSMACGAWSLGYALEILNPGMAAKVFWSKFEYLGIATVTVWVLLFILRYSGRASWFNIKHTLVLLIIPALTILFTFTNESHNLVWTSIAEQPGWPLAPLALGHGWWFWVEIAYSYILLLGGTILLVQFVFRIQRHYLSQPLIMLGAMLVPWLGNAFYILGLRPGPNLDLTPLAFTITNIGLVLAFTRFRLLDILPVAYTSIFKFIGDGIIVIDASHRIIDMNPAARSIFLQASLSPATQPQKTVEISPWIGRQITELLPAWGTSSGADRPNGEKELRLNQGSESGECVYALRTTPIFNRRQQITGHVLIFTDITAVKRSEEELKTAHQQALESNRLKTQLLANVSHDMRTPLGAIIGFSEMLDAGVYGALAPKQKDAVTDIQDSAGQLLLFVNNLIGQAQFETGKILIKPKLFPTNELIDSCKSSVLLPATRKGLEIVCQLDPALPQLLYGDVYWLRQIALNLINNAVKFTDHGCITIRLYQPDPDRWAIEVADTGVGISKEAQVAIFEPFRKSDDPLARERAGSGLGLAIVKELCSLMDAQVSLVSQPGEGSTFTVYFPFTVKESIA